MSIDELIQEAGELTEPPEQRIPRKWFPEALSIVIKSVILPFVLLDLAAQKIARMIIKPPHKKVGACKKRGNCCYYVLIRKSNGLIGLMDLFWHTQINGFYRRTKKTHVVDGKAFYLMGCRYLKKDGRCGSYRLRPTVCRTWPRIEYFGHPQMLKGCGYRAEPRKKGSLSKLPILD